MLPYETGEDFVEDPSHDFLFWPLICSIRPDLLHHGRLSSLVLYHMPIAAIQF